MKRTCKLCKLPQELDRFPQIGAYRLHTCKLCYKRPPRKAAPRTDAQKVARAERRRRRYRALRRLGLPGREAAKAR